MSHLLTSRRAKRTLGLAAIAALAACTDTPTDAGAGAALEPAVAPSYTGLTADQVRLTLFRPLGGNFGRGMDINEAGEIVGIARNRSGGIRGFRRAPTGEVVELSLSYSGYSTYARSVNEAGAVAAGERFPATGFVWSRDGSKTEIGTLGQGQIYRTDVEAIDRLGRVVGSSLTPPDPRSGLSAQHAFLWTPGGGMRDLGTLGGDFSTAWDISDNGHVAGWARTATGEFHATLWTETDGMRDLGTLGGSGSEAHGVNDSGHVVGWSLDAAGAQVAFVWTPATGMRQLPALDGKRAVAEAINNRGEIVGQSLDGSRQWRPVFWTAGGEIVDLGTDGHPGGAAFAVNESGQIVGSVSTATEGTMAALWEMSGPLVVHLDVRPGSTENPVNRKAKGTVPVAVLSTQKSKGEDLDFEATTVDVSTAEFGPGKAKEIHGRGHPEDVDGDGDLDMVMHFDVQVAQLPDGATEACLVGSVGGKKIKGCDPVKLLN